MKLSRFLTLSLIASTGILTSCDKSGELPVPVPYTGEVVVICNGQMSNSIPGSITLYNPKDNTSVLNAFAKANGRYIGTSVESSVAGPNELLYLISTQENTIEIVNAHTMESKGTISMISLFGEKGSQPRYGAYYGDYLYVTTYAGYVCPINIKSLKGEDPIAAGSYPEDIFIVEPSRDNKDPYAWVVNSDYGMIANASISKINLKTKSVEENLKAPEIKNPSKIFADSRNIWFLDRGSYDSNWNQEGAALYKYELSSKKYTKLADATMVSGMGNNGYVIAICNAPWRTPPVTPTYSLIDLLSGTITPLPDVKVDYPAFIGLDRYKLYVGSYTVNPETGFANYNENGYVAVFDLNSGAAEKFECGVGPMDISFTVTWGVN